VARVLQLDEAEHAHLFDLARAATKSGSAGTPKRRRSAPASVRPGVQRLLNAMTGAPALVRNGRLDYLAANPLGRALYAPLFESPAGPPNSARFVFLDPASQDFFVHWDRAADDLVAILRGEAGRHPYDKALTDLIGELSTRSEAFRTRWAAHNVRLHRTGTKQVHHPVVGRLDLSFEALELTADDGLLVHVYSAGPGTASADALQLLASWSATSPQRSARETS
jgi:hypothetical protein